MTYSVGLQEPFKFSDVSLQTALLLLLLPAIFWIFGRIIKNSSLPSFFKRKKRKYYNSQLRYKYLVQVEGIEKEFLSGSIDLRQVHQQLSLAVRRFVQEVTGIPAEHFCYTDIKWIQRDDLTDLIQICYEPEFAFHSDADAQTAIEKSKELIKKWR